MRYIIPISIFLASLVVGCGPGYGGGSLSSYANTDQSTTEVLTQRDSSGQLLFVVAWTAKHGGGGTGFSHRNLLTSIHGREVHPSLDRHAVYALQADGSLKLIPLSDQQVTSFFLEMDKSGFDVSDSELWQKMIVPNLVMVEQTNKNQ